MMGMEKDLLNTMNSNEEIITLVDLDDEIIGYDTKDNIHKKGLLHRAFSIFIFNGNKMLLQKRNENKYHSGGLWTNACCSHQRKKETLETAIHRRLLEELGFDCKLEECFTFVYRNQFTNNTCEYELDHVFVGEYSGELKPNFDEVSEVQWIDIGELKKSMVLDPRKYTTWFIISAPRLMKMKSESVKSDN